MRYVFCLSAMHDNKRVSSQASARYFTCNLSNFSILNCRSLSFSELCHHFRIPREDFTVEDVKNFVGKL